MYKLSLDSDCSLHRVVVAKNQGTPIDFSGVTFKLLVRDDRYSRWFDWSSWVVLQSDGIHIDVPPQETACLDGHVRYYFVLDAIWGDGDRHRVVDGPLYARPAGVQRYGNYAGRF